MISIRLKQAHIIAGISGFFVSILLLFSLWSWGTFRQISVTKTTPQPIAGVPTPTPTPKPPYDTYVILGYGGGGHSGGKLTDTIITVFVDKQRQRITLLSLPRDLWVELPTEPDKLTGWKINAAYAIGSDDRRYNKKPIQFTGPAGGGEMTKYALEKVLGLPIEHFIALDFDGFIRSVDILGGVDVAVAQTFTDPLYPIEGEENNTCGKPQEEIDAIHATVSAEKAAELFPCRYETLHFEKGTQHLDGITALKYVRSRHSPEAGNDFSRSQRQRSLIVAVKNRIFSIDFLPRAIPFINTLAGHVQMDLSIEDLQKLIAEAPQLNQYEIMNLALTDKNLLQNGRSPDRQYVLLPRAGMNNFTEIHQWVKDQLATESATLR